MVGGWGRGGGGGGGLPMCFFVAVQRGRRRERGFVGEGRFGFVSS